ncbi:MAG: PilZ domain-containing protein [Rhodospirillaceae bacterium]|jgi:hypothetical protein|nr:PilZ domain-containing protein [Rhodospirillaceae bacterium]MBT5374406.1 PilZ domain-containing protein [Rhodospirillaceae bacterium]MBT5660376.1 PilZ domain-containing protein [Rhodospirillaceae bacterium]MBT5752458.1 PilZ domain-containing protein [Rhodospirillaceae bacterium]
MQDINDEKRRWKRLKTGSSADLVIDNTSYPARVTDISGGGVSLETQTPCQNGQLVKLDLEGFGDFDAVIIRDQASGLALEFSHAEDDQSSLQEDIDSFRRENDLEWD